MYAQVYIYFVCDPLVHDVFTCNSMNIQEFANLNIVIKLKTL